MSVFDPRLLAALREQLHRRDALLGLGASRVGWKLGMGKRERIGDHIAVGYLTTHTVIHAERWNCVVAGRERELHVDAELCLEFGTDVDPDASQEAIDGAIAHCWPALEVVALAPRPNEPESVLAGNVFHRAVAFGDRPIPLTSTEQVTTYVNRRYGDRAPWPVDLPDRIARAATILAAVDERIRAGDRVITGSITQLPFAVGDLLQARFGDHASVTIRLAREPTPA